MTRLTKTTLPLALAIGLFAGPAFAEPADPHHAEKMADRRKVAELNAAQAAATARRDRAAVQRRDAANATAREQYRAAHDAWRRRVTACRNGDARQCGG